MKHISDDLHVFVNLVKVAIYIGLRAAELTSNTFNAHHQIFLYNSSIGLNGFAWSSTFLQAKLNFFSHQATRLWSTATFPFEQQLFFGLIPRRYHQVRIRDA